VFERFRRSKNNQSPSDATADVKTSELSDLSARLAEARGDKVNFGGADRPDGGLSLTEKAKIVGIVNSGGEGRVLDEP